MAKNTATTSYFVAKRARPDGVLLMLLGDFYEAYGDDAVTVAAAIGNTLTKRDGYPMTGIPAHALGQYLPMVLRIVPVTIV